MIKKFLTQTSLLGINTDILIPYICRKKRMAYISQDFLYQLIHKLEPRQKKDFAKTLRANHRTGDKTNYQVLFEALVGIDKYDELKLKHRLNKSMTDETIAVVKNKLTEKLLNYLRDTSEETPIKKLHKLLDYIEVLFKKQMYNDVVFFCERIKKEAWEADFHTIIIEANRWKGFSLQYIERENYLLVRQELNKETQRSLDMISLTNTTAEYYHMVMAKIHQHFNFRNRDFREYMAKMMENPLFALDAADEKYSFLPACYLAMTKHFLYKIKGDYETAFQQESIVWNRVIKDFNFRYKNKREETLASVANYLEALSKTDHTEAFVNHMAFIEKLLAKEEKGNNQLRSTLIIYQLNHLAKTKGGKLTKHDIEPFEQHYKSGMLDQFIEYKRVFECYLANAHFLLGDYEKARDLMVIAQSEYSRNEIRPDLYEYARINQILYEGTRIISRGVKNEDIPSFLKLVNSYHDHIRHKDADDDYRLEAALTNFFRSLKQNMQNKDILKRINLLERELDAIFSQEQGFLKLIRADFDYPLMIKKWKDYLK